MDNWVLIALVSLVIVVTIASTRSNDYRSVYNTGPMTGAGETYRSVYNTGPMSGAGETYGAGYRDPNSVA